MIEKSINKLDSWLLHFKNDEVVTITKDDAEDILTAIRALSKQTPKRPPISCWTKQIKLICPCCEYKVQYLDRYCSNCGQRLDWS